MRPGQHVRIKGPQRRDQEQIPVTPKTLYLLYQLTLASTKGPGTNPGHQVSLAYEGVEPLVASTKGPGTNPGHLLGRGALHSDDGASTKGPGTNPGHPNRRRSAAPLRAESCLNEGTRNKSRSLPCALSCRAHAHAGLNEGTRNKSRSRLSLSPSARPATRLNEGTRNKSRSLRPSSLRARMRYPPQRRDQEQIPVTSERTASAGTASWSLNEGTRNKSRSLRLLLDGAAALRLASTKGPGTNPGHIDSPRTSRKNESGPQRRDQEQIPVTLRTICPRVFRRGRLNEGTRNKSRSLVKASSPTSHIRSPQRRDQEQIPVTRAS